MALSTTSPYRQAHYVGEYANDAAANAAIASVGWSVGAGMLYYNTTLTALMYYNGTSWAQLGTATAPTWAAVLASGNTSGGTDVVLNNGGSGACSDLTTTPDAVAGGGSITLGPDLGGGGGNLTLQGGDATFQRKVTVTSGDELLVTGSSSFNVDAMSSGYYLDAISGRVGGTMTVSTVSGGAGTINIGDGSANDGYLNIKGTGGVGTLTVESGGLFVVNDITNTTLTGTPTTGNNAVNKTYVDNLIAGIRWKQPVVVRAQGNITLATPGASIDGVAMTAGDRFLADQQTTGTQDGIYVWNGAAVPATRASDAAVGASFANAAMFVEQGTNADTAWVCTNDSGSDVIGTDALTMVQFTGGASLTAGNGIDITGNVISVSLVSPSGLEFSGGDLRIDVATTNELSIDANGLNVEGVPSLFLINGVATSANVTAANLNTLTAGVASDAGSLHMHDGRYFTETELGSTTSGSEGASLIGTDTKTNLNNATTVEAALTELNTRNPPTRSSGAGTPVGVVTGIAGDIYVDTTNGIVYMHYGASNNTSWTVAG